jgi:hypothetical protein
MTIPNRLGEFFSAASYHHHLNAVEQDSHSKEGLRHFWKRASKARDFSMTKILRSDRRLLNPLKNRELIHQKVALFNNPLFISGGYSAYCGFRMLFLDVSSTTSKTIFHAAATVYMIAIV